tara:strand:- start:27 stop:227 length:201 start_codon:yes stop_codon:yes gene_type:complete
VCVGHDFSAFASPETAATLPDFDFRIVAAAHRQLGRKLSGRMTVAGSHRPPFGGNPAIANYRGAVV